MRRHRRYTPTLHLGGLEVLEARQLLSSDTVGVTATTAAGSPAADAYYPSTWTSAITGAFTISIAGPDYQIATSVSCTVTASPNIPNSFTLSNGAGMLGPTGNFVTSPGTITLTPTGSLPVPDERVTLTITGVTSCNPSATYTIAPSTATITIHGRATQQKTPACDPGPLSNTESPGTGNSTPTSSSGAGVAYATGGVSPRSPSLLTSDGYGSIPFGVDLGWTNLPGFDPAASSSLFGSGMTDPNLPYLTPAGNGSLMAVEDAANGIFFTLSGGTYSPGFFSQDMLAGDNLGGFKLTQSDGSIIDYYGFGSSIPKAQWGQLNYYTDAGGNTTTTTYSSGQLTAIGRNDGTTAESYVYSYNNTGVNAGFVSNVALERGPLGGTLSTVQQVAFSYYNGTYTGTDTYGNAGNLKTETLETANATAIGTTYYRYYTPADIVAGGIGYVGGLKYQFDPQSYQRASTYSHGDPTTEPDSSVMNYADQYYEYDQYQRVTKTTVQGAGCSCAGSSGAGNGTYYYGYYTPRTSTDYNTWVTATSEQRPDGNWNYVYTNFAGEVMLGAFDDQTDPANPTTLSGHIWSTYDRYDPQGRLSFEAEPSAVTDFRNATALGNAAGAHTDIVGSGYSGAGTYQYLNLSTGLIKGSDYSVTTSSNLATTPGNIAGYLMDDWIQNGYSGVKDMIDAMQYSSQTSVGLTIGSTIVYPAGVTIYPVATSTVYRTAGGQVTTDSYTWYPGTDQVQMTTESGPVISAAQDGPGTADVTKTVYNTYGWVIWTLDPAGYINYSAYDDGTGSVVESIVDVNSTTASMIGSFPSNFPMPSLAELNLVTTYQVDGQGRTTEETSPANNITYWVYSDPNHQVETYPGWNPSTGTTTGPIEVTDIQYIGNYAETFTMSATPMTTGTAPNLVPTGINFTANSSTLLTLDRVLYDTTGREMEDDSYYNLAGVLYDVARQPYSGYYPTSYGYDNMGRPARVVDAVSTITDTTYDALGRVYSTAVGTDDTYTPGLTGPSNMTTISVYQYDNNGVGDGDLTLETDNPNNSTFAPSEVTQSVYDYRDRLIATKSGESSTPSSEDSYTFRPIILYVLDNLGDVTSVSRFDGDGIALTMANGTLIQPSASLLRVYDATSYDDQGRVYSQQQNDVNQSNGNKSSTALTTTTYYDHRGDVIETSAPGGLVTKDQYDGAGRLVMESETDGAGGTSWAAAGTLGGDHVLTETLTAYDVDGNPTLVTTEDRFNTDTSTDIGPLGNPTAGPKARVSYLASYYDAADRLIDTVDVGTNGGVAYMPPGVAPADSDTVLVTNYQYNSAGWVFQVIDPRGVYTQTTYDNLGRPTTVVDAYFNGPIITAANLTTVTTYDGLDHVTSVEAEPVQSPTQTTTYSYGVTTATGSAFTSNDLLHQILQPVVTASPQVYSIDTYSYDALGDVIAHNDPNNTLHLYYYDALGRQVDDSIYTLATGVDGTVRLLATNYDAQSNAVLFTSFASATGGTIVNQVAEVYNGLGQLAAEYQAVAGPVVVATTPAVLYAYNELAGGANNSRLTSMTYPNGRIINFQYNSSLDASISRVDAVVDASTSTTLESYKYLGLGTVVEWDHPQTGVNLTYLQQAGDTHANTDGGDIYTGLDRFGRVIDQNYTGTSTVRFQYSYDRGGNVLDRNDLVEPALSELYNISGGNEFTAYDLLGRLTAFSRGVLSGSNNTVASPTATQTWSLDGLGNWDGVTTNGSATTTRSFNVQDQATSVSGGATPTYDLDGNTVSTNGQTLVYDAWNWLVSVKVGSTTLAAYTYDASGDRITETYSGTTTALYHDAGGHVIEERSGTLATSPVTSQYVWGASGNLVLRDTVSGGVVVAASRLYALTDANGDVTALVNPSGSVVERYEYSPYGQLTVLTAAGTAVTGNVSGYAWRYQFQGGRVDSATGNYLFGARDYVPASGTWMERDPIGLAGGDLNEYRFVGNDPVGNTDPSGLQGAGMGDAYMSAYRASQASSSSSPSDNLYLYYLHNPSRMDPSLQTTQRSSLVIGAIAATIASAGMGGLAFSAAASNASMASVGSSAIIGGGVSAATGGDPLDGAFNASQMSAAVIGYGQMAVAVENSVRSAITSPSRSRLICNQPATAPKAGLPETTEASVADKLERYLLNPDHPVGGPKAKWFQQALGFSKENAADLAKQIKFNEAAATVTGVTEHGTKFNQVITIIGANGKSIDVTYAWIKNNDGVVRLVTSIPTPR